MSVQEFPINEFLSLAEKNGWEVYTLEQVKNFASDVVKSIDPTEREHGAIDFVSLNRVVVVDENFNKSVVYYRESQIEWKDADQETIEKAGATGLPVKTNWVSIKTPPKIAERELWVCLTRKIPSIKRRNQNPIKLTRKSKPY